jgi:hypothetical protein
VSNGNSILYLARSSPIVSVRSRVGRWVGDVDLGNVGTIAGGASDGSRYLIVGINKDANGYDALQFVIADEHSVISRHEWTTAGSNTGLNRIAATWTGTRYVVAAAMLGKVVIFEVSSTGEMLAPPVSSPSGTLGFIVNLSVASVGDRALIARSDPFASSIITFANGVAGTPASTQFKQVASDAAGFLGLNASYGVRHARLDASGTSASLVATSSAACEQLSVTSAMSGSTPTVAWQEGGGLGQALIRLGDLSPQGAMTIRTPFAPATGEIRVQNNPAMVSFGAERAMTWYEVGSVEAGLRFGRVQPDGISIGRSTVGGWEEWSYVSGEEPEYLGAPAIVWGGDSWLVFWSGRSGAIYRAIVSPDGQLVRKDRIYTSSRGATPTHLSVVRGNGGSLLVWQDGDRLDAPPCYILCPAYPQSRVAALMIDATGSPIGAPIQLAGDRNVRPAAAWNGEEYLVAWLADPALQNGRVDFARITPAGTVIPTPSLVRYGSLPLESVSVAAMGRSFLVATGASSPGGEIYLTRVDRGIAGPPMMIDEGTQAPTLPQLFVTSPSTATIFYNELGLRGSETAQITRLQFRNLYLDGVRRRAAGR